MTSFAVGTEKVIENKLLSLKLNQGMLLRVGAVVDAQVGKVAALWP